jgi:hypothetical protein
MDIRWDWCPQLEKDKDSSSCIIRLMPGYGLPFKGQALHSGKCKV